MSVFSLDRKQCSKVIKNELTFFNINLNGVYEAYLGKYYSRSNRQFDILRRRKELVCEIFREYVIAYIKWSAL